MFHKATAGELIGKNWILIGRERKENNVSVCMDNRWIKYLGECVQMMEKKIEEKKLIVWLLLKYGIIDRRINGDSW